MSYEEEIEGLDLAMALSRVGGDDALLREIAQIFLCDLPANLSEVTRAVAARDPKALERSAHSLKGAVANFGARSVVEAARSLELMGRNRTLESSTEALARLEAALESLETELNVLISAR